MAFGVRAKKIKNQVRKNEELTGEEWRRRYMQTQHNTRVLVQAVESMEAELSRWRGGNAVPPSEWFSRDAYHKILSGDVMKEQEKSEEPTRKPKGGERPLFSHYPGL